VLLRRTRSRSHEYNFWLQENLVVYICNYIRVALLILLMVTYLRPKAILGILALGYSGYNALKMLESASRRKEIGGIRSLQHKEELEKWDLGQASYNKSMMAIMTWFLIIYSRCMPIILLAILLSGLFILMHASLMKSVSEHKVRGRKVLSYRFMEVIRNSSRTGDPRFLLRELAAEAVSVVFKSVMLARKWSLYSMLWTRDQVKACFRPRDTLSWN